MRISVWSSDVCSSDLALARGEMFLQYQPKLHLRRQQVAGAEALVRWQHPTRGLILPGDFIEVAEEAREIGPLTLWTLRQVIEDQQRLARHGHDIVLSIRSEEHTSELQSLMRISYAVFCLKKKKNNEHEQTVLQIILYISN